MTKTNIKPKLSKDEIATLIIEKEAELARQCLLEKYDASLKRLIRRMEKDKAFIGRKLFAHTESKEENRWEIKNWRST